MLATWFTNPHSYSSSMNLGTEYGRRKIKMDFGSAEEFCSMAKFVKAAFVQKKERPDNKSVHMLS